MRARVTDLLHAHTELKLPSDIDTDMAAAAEDGEAAAAAAAVNRRFLAARAHLTRLLSPGDRSRRGRG